ncbi:YeiH family protein [Natranaerobius trueperi]|uniref:Sulfate exporter family transporter n=1 Tax=Natranaerobius trueperi TaxID=759412 RepID=A0A226C0C3_9FIRM|nr:putative sulfate exporter family transporter [Natranaerobius trueperi]OWZ84676.1 hypothetical protein CDO51_02630 [Natranaerobius trueperi]
MVSGIVLTFLIAIIALTVNFIYSPISPVLIAVFLGIIIKNSAYLPKNTEPGIKYSAKKLLKLGIILLGVRLSFFDILNLGFSSLLIIIICILLALSLVINLSRFIGVPKKLATLIAIGTAICGNTAIVASAPVIKAKEEEVAFAVATITVFGLSAIIIYPLIGGFIGLTQVEFGTWAGTAINDTGQVIASGFLYGDKAGEVSTIVKLTRNIFLAPVVFLFSHLTVKNEASKEDIKVDYTAIFPWFVVGFLGMALLRTTGILPETLISTISFLSDLLIVMALAGIGLGIQLSSLKGLGLKAFFTGLTASFIMGITSLLLITLLL